ncbi:MAG: hypothetical protein HON90_16235 [Halobacteriovoraceae bacterium]|jgi:hypothetical protein|nr:hypothetical protein [Halobacteriovoraceae bacterium]
MKKLFILLSMGMLLISCIEAEVSADEKPSTKDGALAHEDIDTQNELNGKINGASWRYTYAIAKKSILDPTKYNYSFYDEEISDACSHFPQAAMALYSGKLEVSKISFNNLNNMTLSFNSDNGYQNLIATIGFIKIEEINDDFAYATLKAAYDPQNYLGGKVEIKICD